MQNNFIVEPKSRKDLRELTLFIRKIFSYENTLYFPVTKFLEVLPEISSEFNFEIVEDHELPFSVHADTDVLNHCIRIKNSVYENAHAGHGRDRMTIAHEIGHYFTICVLGFKLQRNFGNKPPRACEDPEWQVKCFAGELLVPAHLVSGMDAKSISMKCGVSLDAAQTQLKSLRGGGSR